jgi:hypothetical protein
VLAVALTVASDSLGDLFGGDGTPGPTDSTATTAGQTTVQVVQATSFDPLTRDADKQENEDEAPLAIDDDPDTSWETEGYNDNLGPFKQGVGLVLDLGEPKATGRLSLTMPAAGAELTIYGSDNRPETLEGWQELAGPQAAGQRASFDLGGQPHRYLLVWFTSLPQGADGKFRGGISAVTLRS